MYDIVGTVDVGRTSSSRSFLSYIRVPILKKKKKLWFKPTWDENAHQPVPVRY